MAEIDVVKKNSRVWLWVLIAIVIVAALLFVMRGSGVPRAGQLIEPGHQPMVAVSTVMQV
jgi:hypothetical protein